MSYNSKYIGEEVEALLDDIKILKSREQTLSFFDVYASEWIDDETYPDFQYKCVLSCNGVTANDYASVIFDVEQALSGDYAPVCETGENTVTIWSSKNDSITIPTILIIKQYEK